MKRREHTCIGKQVKPFAYLKDPKQFCNIDFAFLALWSTRLGEKGFRSDFSFVTMPYASYAPNDIL